MSVKRMLLENMPQPMPGTLVWIDGKYYRDGVLVKPRKRIKKRDRQWLPFMNKLHALVDPRF